MSLSEAQIKATKKYRQKFIYLQARVTHEEKSLIDQHISGTDESVSNFIRRAISETIKRDKEKKPQE